MIALLATVATVATAAAPNPGCVDRGDCAGAIEAAVAAGDADLSGHWPVTRPVTLRCSQPCRIRAGTIEAAPDGDPLPYVVALDLVAGSEIEGILHAHGRRTGWHQHRTAVDGVHVTRAQGVRLDGLDVRWVRRWGVVVGARGSSAIGAHLGTVRVTMAGTPGGVGAPPHTRSEVTASRIERHGGGRSTLQRATVTVDEVPPDLRPGDRAWVGLHLVEVVDIRDDALEVYPWPGPLDGDGDWPVDLVIGGGVQIRGGNTTGITIDGLVAGYVGVGLEVASLYGAHVRAPVIEVAGVGVVIGGRRATTWGLTLHGLHPEITGLDVLQAGTTVARCLVLSPVVDLTDHRYHVARPTLPDGTPWDAPAWRRRCDQLPEVP